MTTAATIPFVEDLDRKIAARADKHRRAVEQQVARTDVVMERLRSFVLELRPFDSSTWTGR